MILIGVGTPQDLGKFNYFFRSPKAYSPPISPVFTANSGILKTPFMPFPILEVVVFQNSEREPIFGSSMHIGNDIIDLQVDRSDDARFAERTLSSDELSALALLKDGPPVVCFFGVKEAFYKTMRQIDPKYPLKPRSIKIDFDNLTAKTVDSEMRFSFFRNHEFFYSCTLPEVKGHRISAVAILPISFSADPELESKGVRDLAKLLLSSIFGFPPEDFSFGRGPGGEPIPHHIDDPLTYAVSFTHHGRYCAVALASEGSLTTARIRQLKEQLNDKTVLLQIENLVPMS